MKAYKEKIKKAIKIFTVVFVSVVVVGVISFSSAYAIAESSAIDENDAISNAYKAAGVTADEVDAVKSKFKFDDGKFVYDIEFYKGGVEFEYKIHSKDGSIVEFDHPEKKPLPQNAISVDKAKETALAHAGFKAEEVTFSKVKSDKEKGKHVYEIEFTKDNVKYEYEIDANSGKIKEFETEDKSEMVSSDSADSFISIEKAKEIALETANATTEKVHFVKTKLEKDDGRYVFEIEFVLNGIEHECEIDAKSGEIIKHEKDEPANVETLITLDTAKQAALTHFSLSAENVKFIKAKLDEEDGVWVYEIEFISGSKEYECEIKAEDGTVLKAKEKVQERPRIPVNPDVDSKVENPRVEENTPAIPGESENAASTPDNVERQPDTSGNQGNVKPNNGSVDDAFPDDFKKDVTIPSDKKTSSENKNSDKQKNSFISPEEAESIVFNHISIHDNQIKNANTEFESDDGRFVYDIEFIHNDKEHEFSVDAISGEIIEFDMERK